MSKKRIFIQSEYSAQRMSHPPNPAIALALQELRLMGHKPPFSAIADVGCGKLRHFKIFSSLTKRLYLVDTEEQITREHVDSGKRYTVANFAREKSNSGGKFVALSSELFCKQKYALDLIFCVAVFDVVPRQVRQNIIASCAMNLKKGGHFIVIVPRNDSTITDRFSEANRYMDGHVFERQGIHTFFCNFQSYSTILSDCEKHRLVVTADLSRYRQVCLILSKQ